MFFPKLLPKNSISKSRGFRHLVSLVFNFWGYFKCISPYATQLSFYLEIIGVIGRVFHLDWTKKHLWCANLKSMLVGWNAIEASRTGWFRRKEMPHICRCLSRLATHWPRELGREALEEVGQVAAGMKKGTGGENKGML